MYTMRCALLLTSMGFSIVATASYLATLDPAHALMHGFCSAFVMGVLGGIMGYMIDHPAGQKNKFWDKFWRDLITIHPEGTEAVEFPVEAQEIPNTATSSN